MDKFTYGGKTVSFERHTGEVLSSDRHSRAHISTSGGGGFVHNGGGIVYPTNVHSTVQTDQQFWIRTDDGRELDFQFSNSDIPLRVGQKITVVSATTSSSRLVYRTLLVNHNAGKYWKLVSGESLNNAMQLCKWSAREFVSLAAGFLFLGLLGPIWIAAELPALGWLSSYVPWLAGGLFVSICARHLYDVITIEQLLDEHIVQYAQRLLEI